jgi:hypothetical protein
MTFWNICFNGLNGLVQRKYLQETIDFPMKYGVFL